MEKLGDVSWRWWRRRFFRRKGSTGGFGKALAALSGSDSPGLSAGIITRLTSVWQNEYEPWLIRDLSAWRSVYSWADGVHFSPRIDHYKQCVLVKDREQLLTFYDFPTEHCKRIHTSNPIESTFATVRQRTVKTKNCLGRETTLVMAS
jgi:hypothetical protein